MLAPAPSDPAARGLLPVLLFVGTVVAVLSSLGAPLVPTIAEVDHVSLAAAQWSLTISLLVGAVATPALGRLGDGPRRKTVLLSVLGGVLAGSVLAALPLGFAALLTGRALQGLGLGLTPLVIAVAREHLPKERVPSAVALLSITTVAGVGFGYPLTGLLTDALGLHSGFWFGALVSGLALLVAAWRVPSSAGTTAARFDLLGAGLLGGALAGLLVTLSEGPEWGTRSPLLWGLVCASGALLAVWARHEHRTPAPLIDVDLLRHRSVLTAAVTGLLAGVGMYLLLSLVTRFVQTPPDAGYGFGSSVVVAGLVLLPFSLASVLASRVAPWIAKMSANAVLPVGCALFLVADLAFATVHDALWQLFVVMAVAGLGVGCTFAALPGLILRAVPASETGSAMGFNQVLRMTGFSAGSALSAMVLELHTPAGQLLPTESGYVAAAVVGGVTLVVAGVLSAVLPERARAARRRVPTPA